MPPEGAKLRLDVASIFMWASVTQIGSWATAPSLPHIAVITPDEVR